MLNNCGKNEHACLLPDYRRKHSIFPHEVCCLVVVVFIKALYVIK